ncbi:LETM1 and EF-hand domain-containing protein 1, mitochondrial [Morella rubra]|uniref:LETM1 and EF-hand domain-containing protein 1, mitochondrial n=1 Tax=Morella rubra TaxID=262757 RepID=A0A6A1V9N1_9ROSI|nr:LETM1 and EF-hand domain-containing protein 1, mitochondrial [Morella rubra]
MASRAILRRKKSLFNSLNQSTRLIQGFPSFEQTVSSTSNELVSSSHPLVATNYRNGVGLSSAIKDGLQDGLPGLLGAEFQRNNSFAIPTLSFRNGRVAFTPSLGVRWISQSISHASAAPAGQPQMAGGIDENEIKVAKKIKEASPEECDQAVEGLSTVKAKAKAKQMQESQKTSESLMTRVWAKLLGIGPALRAVASMSREDWAKKFRHWGEEFKSTMQHYWLGTKLLWADVRISSRLLVKVAKGKTLSRRERQQLTRTTADIFRLVPVAVFIIVPFMEFLLPVFLKLFPNMLPSTFQDKMKEQEELKRRLNARMGYAKFLQETVKEMARRSKSLEVELKNSGKIDEFINNVRRGTRVSNDEILGFAKLFNDELTLDNISSPSVYDSVGYQMTFAAIGFWLTLQYLTKVPVFVIEHRPRIKNDDRLIQAEGLESLSEAELRQACRDRGMLDLPSVVEMRQQLRDWLDLSLNHSLPSSLLILSRAFSMSGKKPEEVVQEAISSLPDEVVDTVQVTTLPSEDTVSERRRKLEFLEMQEEMIKEEEEEEEEEQAKMKESVSSQKDVALEEMTTPTAREAREQARRKTLENVEELCELSRALAVLASASSVSREREEFLQLVTKEIDLYNSMVEKEGTDGEEEAKKAYKAAREESDHAVETAIGHKVSSALINRVDAMLHKLEKEIDDVDAKIGDRWRLLDRDYDGKVTPEEVASAAMYLKDTLGKEGIQELISNLSKDKGKWQWVIPSSDFLPICA